MYQRLFLSALLLCISFSSFSQRVLNVNSIEESNKVFHNFIEVYSDTTNSLEFEQIISKNGDHPINILSDFKEEISSSNTYWLHFILDYIPQENLDLGLKIPIVNHYVEVYSTVDSSIQKQHTGICVVGKENDEIIPFSNIIEVSGADRIEYYVKIKIKDDRIPELDLKLVNIQEEFQRKIRTEIFQSFLQGIMFLMILYGLFLYFNSRDNLYLFYTLYIISFSIWSLFYLGYQFLPGLPRGIYDYPMIFAYLALFFYIQFVRSFLDTARVLPKWNRIFRVLQVAILVLIVGLHLFTLVTDLHLFSSYLHGLSTLIISAFIVLFIIKVFRTEVPFSNIIWIGSSFLIIGTIGATIRYFTADDHLYNFQKIGTILELIVFSYGVTLRYRMAQEEKRQYQEKLIDQLKENTKIQERANRELEAKVIERTAEIAAQRDLVTQQHNSITESIRYAKKIQSALLPPEAYVNELLKENFILFKPRDIVSGDFYWIRQIRDYIFVVAADCTGHGVPGALMSMLGISFLNEIVHNKNIEEPKDVLNELRRQVKYSLRQTGKEGETKDGMDLALAAINTRENTLQFSGAYNPVFIIRDKELIEIKADKMPIGIHPNERPTFTNHMMELQFGDNIYLFSDGFSDQMGKKTGKKFMSRNFKELLKSISQDSMQRQKETLDETIEAWKDGVEQTDDILVIGVRV